MSPKVTSISKSQTLGLLARSHLASHGPAYRAIGPRSIIGIRTETLMFITYNDLNDMRDTRKRSQINAFVNRSRKAIKVKSAQRQARAVQWQSQRATPSTATVKIKSEASTPGTDVIDFGNPHISKDLIFALLKKQRLPPLALQYGLGGLRRDPFASFPVPQTDQIEWAADFCE